MKSPRLPRLPLTRAAALALTLLVAPSLRAQTTYYWDNNGATAGFGTAGGTWAAPTTNNSTQGWSTDSTGATLPSSTTNTTTSDALNFGTGSAGLALGTITVSGTVNANSLTFGSASGNITLSGGTITLGGTTPTITTNNTADTISSVLAGSAGMTKNGTGSLILTGANTYTGTTTINAGTLQIGNNGTTGSLASTTIVNNANLVYDLVSDGSTTVALPSGITGSGNLTVSGGRIQFGGNITQGGNMTFTQKGYSGGGTWPNSIRMTASSTLTASSITMNGLIGQDGANTYNMTLDTSAANGPINLNLSAAQSGRYYNINAFTANAGTGTLNFAGSPSMWGVGTTSLTGALNVSASFSPSTLHLNATGNSSVTGAITLGTATSNIWTVSPGVTMTASGVLAGSSAAITKNGTGTLTLSNAANTYNGTTTINAGTLAVSGNISSSAITINSGGVISAGSAASSSKFNAASLTVNGGSGYAFTITNVGTSTAGTDYDQIALSGALTLNNTSANKFTVYLYGTPIGWSGANTYTWDIITAASQTGFTAGNFTTDFTNFGIASGLRGGNWTFTNPSNGTIRLTYAGVIGDSYWSGGTGNWDSGFSPAMAEGNNITYNGTGGGTSTNNISTSSLGAVGNITFSAGAGAYTLAANAGSAGASGGTALSVTGNIVNNSSNLQTINAALAIGSTRTVDAASGNIAIGGAISGIGGLTKNGSNTLTLSGANTYNGTTTVSAGTLTLSGPNTGGGAVMVDGGTMNIQGNLTLGSGQFTVGNAGAGVVNHSAGTVSITSGNGLIVGNGATSSSNGTYNLSGGVLNIAPGANRGITLGWGSNSRGNFNMSGGTLVNSGTLQIGQTTDSDTVGQLPVYNQTGGDATHGTLTMGGSGTYRVHTTTTTLSITGGNFSASNFTVLSGGTLNVANILIGGNAIVTLPAFPTSRGGGASVNLTFDGGTLRPTASSAAYLGGLTSATIRAGGVTFDTNSNNITVSQALLTNATSTGGGLTKNGTGTLILSGANTYTGTTTVNTGTLQIGAGSTTGSLSSSSSITNNGTLTFNRTDTLTQGTNFGTTINGTGNLIQAGTGTTILSGANTYTGTTTINAGTLQIGAGSTTGTLSTSSAITNNGTIVINRSNTVTQGTDFANSITGTGNLTQSGSGTLVLGTGNTYSGATTVNGGTLQLTGNISSSALTIGNGGIVSIGTTSAIAKYNASSITIQGGSGYAFTIGNVNSSVAGTDYDQLTATGALTLSNTAASPFTVYLNGAPTDWSNSGTYSWDIISAASQTGFTAGNFSVNLNSFGIASANRTGTWTFTNPSGGTVRLTYAAATPDYIWSGTSGNWSTGFTPTAPTTDKNLVFTGSSGTATNDIGNGTLSSINFITFNSTAGAYTLNATTGAAGLAGGTALTVKGDILNNSSNAQTIAMNLAFGSSSTGGVDTAAGNITISGNISGTGALNKAGNSTLTLNGNNTYNGTTTINAGTLQVGGSNGNIAGAIVNNANLVYTSSAFGIYGVTGTGNLTINQSSGNVYLQGNITQSGTVSITTSTATTTSGMIQSALGTQNTNRMNTSITASAITINGMIGAYQDNTRILTLDTSAANGAITLDLQNGSSGTWNPVSIVANAGTGNFTLSGSKAGTAGTAWTANNGNSFTGALNISSSFTSGSLTLNATGNSSVTGNLNFQNGSNAPVVSVTVNPNLTMTFSGNITQTSGHVASLTKNGNGTLTLSGTNTYSGGTTVNAGTLQVTTNGGIAGGLTINGTGVARYSVNATNYFGSLSSLALTNGGTFIDGSIGSYVQTTPTLTFNNGGTLSSVAGATGDASLGNLLLPDINVSGTGLATINATAISFNYSKSITVADTVAGSGVDLEISSIIRDGRSSGQTLTKAGAGTLRLSGNNTSLAMWTISAGTLEIGAAGRLTSGNYAANITNNGAFIYSGTNNQILSGVISGSGALTQNASSTLTLSGNNTYSGTTTINAGTIEIGAAGRLGAGTYAQNITNNGTLIYSGTNAQTLSGVISGTGNLTQNASSTLTLSGANTYTGTTTVNAGTLAISNNMTIGAITGSGNLSLGSGFTLTTNSTSNSTFSGVISGSGALAKNGASSLTLGANNTYSGATTISAGTIEIGAAGRLGGGNYSQNIANNGVLIYSGTNNQTLGGVISGTGALTHNASSTLTLAGNSNFNGATTINAGTLVLSGTNTASAITVASGATLMGSGSGGATTVSGTIAPGNSPGTLTVGSLTLNGGGVYTWEMADATGAAGTGWDRIASTGLLTVNSTSGSTFTIAITSSGAPSNWNYQTSNQSWDIITYGSVSGFDATKFSINATAFGGTLGGSASTWALSDTGSALRLTYTYAADPIWAGGNASWSAGFSPAITNGADATFTGAGGTATNDIVSGSLSSIDSITFDSTAGAYTLAANSGSSGYDTASALQLNGNIINNSTATQTINLALTSSASRVFDAASGNLVIGGAIAGVGGLTKNGSNKLTLSANNTYSGDTTINAGTLEIASTGLLGGGSYSGNIVNTGAFLIGSNSNQTLSGVISGIGALTKNGTGTLTLAGNNNYSGGTTLNTGTLVIGNAAAAGTGTITQANGSSLLKIDTTGTITNDMSVYNVLASQSATLSGAITVNNATWDIDTGDTLTISGAVSGNGGVTKNGGGTLTLNGTNTYNGSTVVNAGTLNANSTNALGSNNTVQVNGGSLLVTADDAINGKNIELGGSGVGLQFSGTYSGAIGNLTLSANSIIDLGAGSVQILFQGLNSSNHTLSFYNWSGTTLWNGGNGTTDTDKVYFGPDLSDEALAKIYFYTGPGDSFLGSGFDLGLKATGFIPAMGYQIIPVPEPETYATGLLLLLGGAWWMWKRNRKLEAGGRKA